MQTVTGWFSGKQWPADKHVICTDCFFKLVVENSEKCLRSCLSLGSPDVATGFPDNIDLKIMGKILKITEFSILSFLYSVKYFYFFNLIPKVYFQRTVERVYFLHYCLYRKGKMPWTGGCLIWSNILRKCSFVTKWTLFS